MVKIEGLPGSIKSMTGIIVGLFFGAGECMVCPDSTAIVNSVRKIADFAKEQSPMTHVSIISANAP